MIKRMVSMVILLFHLPLNFLYAFTLFSIISMSSNFLGKFQGKMTAISRLGPENLLKGNDTSIIYTNTAKSFGALNKVRAVNARHDTEESSKRESEQVTDDKRSLHLPTLGERYLSQQSKYQRGHGGKKEIAGFIDRQTNWLIEDYPRASSPLSNNNTTSNQLILKQKKNSRASPKKNPQRNYSLNKIVRLGGLGPNIGGQEWQARNAKKEKAMNYANNLRRKKQEREMQQEQSNTMLRMDRLKGLLCYD